MTGPARRILTLLLASASLAIGTARADVVGDGQGSMGKLSAEEKIALGARYEHAQGLMQLMPDTARRFRVRNAFDPEDNIKGGLAYLQWLMAFFKGNVILVAAAYNAGERAVENHRGIPPYPETQNYVRKITALYKKTSHPFKDNSLAMTSSVAKAID